MMTRAEYDAWWIAWGDNDDLPEPVCTLVEHVAALQTRIDNLPEALRCCCAYDHPEMRCSVQGPADR